MKDIIEEHIKFQCKFDPQEANKDPTKEPEFSREGELRKLIQGKYALISDAVLPVLQKVPVAAVFILTVIRG